MLKFHQNDVPKLKMLIKENMSLNCRYTLELSFLISYDEFNEFYLFDIHIKYSHMTFHFLKATTAHVQTDPHVNIDNIIYIYICQQQANIHQNTA